MRDELTLLENAHDFARESLRATERAMNAGEESVEERAQYKFALIHIAQAVELLLKERLHREHPLLVYERPEKPKRTVGVEGALERLGRCGLHIESEDVARLKAARDLRNELVHHHAGDVVGEQYFQAFRDLFEFSHQFAAQYLGTELHDVFDEGLHLIEALLIQAFRTDDLVIYQGAAVSKGHPVDIVTSQFRPSMFIDGEFHGRIPYGEDGFIAERPCHDCAVLPGQYHTRGCDVERCPRCSEQFLTCPCEDETDQLIAKSADE